MGAWAGGFGPLGFHFEGVFISDMACAGFDPQIEVMCPSIMVGVGNAQTGEQSTQKVLVPGMLTMM